MPFSIRDYTNKMRTVNAFQCWPFDLGQLSQEDIQSKLPPMNTTNDGRRRVETNNSLGEVSQNDDVASTGEKSLSRRKSRLRTFTKIIDLKNDAEKRPQTQVVVPLPPLLPPPPASTYPEMGPPPPRSSNTQIGDLMNVIVVDDDEEEDSQLITQFRRRLEGPRSDQYPLDEIFMAAEINVASMGNAAKLKLQNPVSNEPKKLKDTLGDSDAAAQEKKWYSKNLSEGEKIHCHYEGPSSIVLASSVEKDKFCGSDEGTENLKRKELCLNIQMKQNSNGSAVQKFLKSCANQEKSMPLVKKSKSLSKVTFCDDNLVQFAKGDTPKVQFSSNAEPFQSAAANLNASSRTHMEQNFNGLSLDSNGKLIKFSSSGKVAMNQPERSSNLRGSFSGLAVINSPHHSRQENLSIGERNVAPNTLQNQIKQVLLNRIDSEPKLIKGPCILPKESSSLISPCSSQPRMSTLKGREIQIGRDKQKRVDFRVPEESRMHFSEGGLKQKSYTGSKLQISTENLFQPVKLESSRFQQSNLHFSQNRSLGSVSINSSTNISDPFPSRTISQRLISNPLLNNGILNDRKRNHNGTCSAFELSHLPPPPPPPSSWCPPTPIVQPAHVSVTNQPSPINRYTVKGTAKDNLQFSSSRKRSATEFIDLTKPNKLPNLEQQENSSRVTKTYKDLNSEKDDINLS
ncbi:hypothetical protein TSUD_131430 [Trifolium subterraneum]|uniref:Uncharacterized protein n=1 Tax=Trifolium subterraneum TaxID=3900 RepID=A0A2Z6P199_TRISU|nr:hypothetical protein TSUD_131430 [Trifolium subterraneum]